MVVIMYAASEIVTGSYSISHSSGAPGLSETSILLFISRRSNQVPSIPVYVSVSSEIGEGPVTRQFETSHQILKLGGRFMKRVKVFVTAYCAVLATYVTTLVETGFVAEYNATQNVSSTRIDKDTTMSVFVIELSKFLYEYKRVLYV
jgi:hypothetical protein